MKREEAQILYDDRNQNRGHAFKYYTEMISITITQEEPTKSTNETSYVDICKQFPKYNNMTIGDVKPETSNRDGRIPNESFQRNHPVSPTCFKVIPESLDPTWAGRVEAKKRYFCSWEWLDDHWLQACDQYHNR